MTAAALFAANTRIANARQKVRHTLHEAAA